MTEAVKRPRGRPRKLAPGPVDPVVRFAVAVEELVKLYKLDLSARGINVDPQDMGEGEILVTDDTQVAARIERDRNFSGIERPGFYVGEESESILDREGKPRGQEVAVNWDPSGGFSALLGGSGGFNVGPEGAEEDRPSPHGNWSTREQDPGPVYRPRSSEVPEGQSRPDSGEKLGGNP